MHNSHTRARSLCSFRLTRCSQTTEIVFLATVSFSQQSSLRSSYQQLIFQTRFTIKNCSVIPSALPFIKRACSGAEGEHEFTAMVTRACASCGRDLIAACDFDGCSIAVNADSTSERLRPLQLLYGLVFSFRSPTCREEW